MYCTKSVLRSKWLIMIEQVTICSLWDLVCWHFAMYPDVLFSIIHKRKLPARFYCHPSKRTSIPHVNPNILSQHNAKCQTPTLSWRGYMGALQTMLLLWAPADLCLQSTQELKSLLAKADILWEPQHPMVDIALSSITC